MYGTHVPAEVAPQLWTLLDLGIRKYRADGVRFDAVLSLVLASIEADAKASRGQSPLAPMVERELISVANAAVLIGRSTETTRTLARSGRFGPVEHVGRGWMLDARAVRAFAKSHRPQSRQVRTA